jgi:hypothetical protein
VSIKLTPTLIWGSPLFLRDWEHDFRHHPLYPRNRQSENKHPGDGDGKATVDDNVGQIESIVIAAGAVHLGVDVKDQGFEGIDDENGRDNLEQAIDHLDRGYEQRRRYYQRVSHQIARFRVLSLDKLNDCGDNQINDKEYHESKASFSETPAGVIKTSPVDSVEIRHAAGSSSHCSSIHDPR